MKRYLPLTLLIIALIGAWIGGVADWLSLQNMQAIRADVQNIYQQHPAATLGGFALLYMAVVALGLPVALPLSLLGGAVFGSSVATPVVAASATLGATVLFLAARSALGDILRHRARRFYNRAKVEMKSHAIFYLLFLRLVPIFPFFIANTLPALFPISLKVFVLTTFFGILPGVFVFTNLGSALGDITSLSDLLGWQTLLAFSLLGGLALVPVAIKKKMAGGLPYVTLPAGFLVNTPPRACTDPPDALYPRGDLLHLKF